MDNETRETFIHMRISVGALILIIMVIGGLVICATSCTPPMKHERVPANSLVVAYDPWDEVEYDMLYAPHEWHANRDTSQVDSLGGDSGDSTTAGGVTDIPRINSRNHAEPLGPTLSIPWPRPLTIYEFNMWPASIRHGYLMEGGSVGERLVGRPLLTSLGFCTAVKGNSFPCLFAANAAPNGQLPATPFLWSFTSLRGVGVLELLTGAQLPTLPCVIIVKQTDGRI